MKTTIQIALIALLVLTVGQAKASMVVDPTAAALGSSTIFDPVDEDEGAEALAPTISNMPIHWQGVWTSEVYLVRRQGRSGVWFSRPGVSGSLRPINPGTGTVDVDNWRGGEQTYNTPRIHDPNRREWIGLDLRRGRPPIIVTPRGGGQPHTPTTPAPEPGTVMLLASGLGAVGAAGYARRRLIHRG